MPDHVQPNFLPAVIAPTYNNARTLSDILGRLARLDLPLIIVNDGSTDDTADILSQWQQQPHHAPLTVLTHPLNRGKAAALHTAFAAAIAAGHTHAATIDTDGQLDPEQVPQLLDIARTSPAALILGTRDDTQPDYPARSRLGRRLSNGAIRLETGQRIADSQCGLRVYPLGLLRAVRCRAPYFAFEAEIITRAAWAGCPIIEVPVNCRYLPGPQRVSHFKPVRDSIRGILLHARLLARAFTPWPHRVRWPGDDPQISQMESPRRKNVK